jgi:hypothetical protein
MDKDKREDNGAVWA